MLAEHAAHGVGDLAEGRVFLGGRDDRRPEVRGPAGCRFDRVQRRTPFALAAPGADGRHALDLAAFDVGVYAEEPRVRRDLAGWRGLALRKPVNPDDDGLACIDLLLRTICRILDLLLDIARLDRRERSADLIDPVKEVRGRALDSRRHLLDRVGARDGVDRVRDTALMQDDLLRAQGNRGALFSW